MTGFPKALLRAGVALAIMALPAASLPARAQSAAPAMPMPTQMDMPAQAAGGAGREFVYLAVGAAAGAVLLQAAMADGLALMAAAMGAMVGEMVYDRRAGPMPPGPTPP